MQINAVEPLTSSSIERLSGRAVPEEIEQYNKHNNVCIFIFSRPVIKQGLYNSIYTLIVRVNRLHLKVFGTDRS